MSRTVVAFFFLLVTLLAPSLGGAKEKTVDVEYKRGARKGAQEFVSAESCNPTPCIITQWGILRLPEGIEKTDRVQLGALHRGLFNTITLFQESTSFEQKVSERVFNRKPNRKVIDLQRLMESGKTNAIYIYGLLLQYELDEGDLLALQLVSLKNPSKTREYYFRYHHDGSKFDVDVAFVQPINVFTPNPGNIIQAAYTTVAFSFSMARAMDPERHYSLPGKVLRAARFNLFLGLLLRKDVGPFNGDNITKEFFDGFGGLGLTVFDFFSVGYGANFVRSPHTTFPFVGIEVRHLLEFLHSFKSDTHSRWQKYLKEEMEKKP